MACRAWCAVCGDHPRYNGTSSSQTALAVNTAVSTVGSFVFAIPGGWLGDRFGRYVITPSPISDLSSMPLAYPWGIQVEYTKLGLAMQARCSYLDGVPRLYSYLFSQ